MSMWDTSRMIYIMLQLKLAILSHRSKNRTSDSTEWKSALATEADSQYSRRIPYGMIVDQVKIPGLAVNHNQNTHHPDYILRVSVTALRESGYYDQNIVPLVALLNVVALSVLTFQDSDLFHRALITLNIAFVEISIRMTADSHLPSVGYQIRLQRVLNEWFVILMMLLLEGMLVFVMRTYLEIDESYTKALDWITAISAFAHNIKILVKSNGWIETRPWNGISKRLKLNVCCH
ncbi:hypothetical protein IV203_011304 [Nitzschia inconspicua]|uniref:Uncharacterized protein n=1 Tax=Nitzschia inconspicua TaxID=303405 RepID=A0A9K3KS29_9STRA|nr:hypothetical protein IV203_011304 [Nitzschia inconspicua]